MFVKYKGETCHGVQLHVTSRQEFLPYRTGVAIVKVIHEQWPKDFGWRTTPYEFRDDVPAMDLLTGHRGVREGIEAGQSLEAVMKTATFGTGQYDAGRGDALLYS